MSGPERRDGAAGADASAVAPLDPRTRELLRELLRIAPEEARRVREATAARRRPSVGPSADYGDGPSGAS